MTDQQGFPLPGSSYKELIKIIQGYGQAGADAAPSDVAKVISIHETIVSSSNKFLVAVGIIQGGKKKTMTAPGKELALALLHGMEEETGRHWRSVVDSTDFLQKVVAAVRIRKGMDESSLLAHIAYSAGQPRTPKSIAGAGAIVEILRVSGLLKEEGGNLVAATPEPLRIPEATEVFPHLPSEKAVLRRTAFVAEPRVPGGIQINIDVRIQCTPNELDGLGQKLKQMIDDLGNDKKVPHDEQEPS